MPDLMVMRSFAILVALVMFVPAAHAGSRENPELTDPQGDVTRWPGVPTVDPSTDFIAAWFSEDEEHLNLHMEVVQHFTYDQEVSNVVHNSDHLIGVHVNGEGERTPCSGWGTFNVRDRYLNGDWSGFLRVYWPMEQQDGGCAGDDYEDVAVTMEGNVATMRVPWNLVPGLVSRGDILSFADTRAGSSSLWPATTNDYADNLPSREFTVTLAPPREEWNQIQNATQSPAEGPVDASDQSSEQGPGTSQKETPTSLFLVVAALAIPLFSRRTA